MKDVQMNRIMLSIVIPTKNRYKYLVGALQSFTLLQRNDFEVVIQDNSDDNSFICDYLTKHKEYDFVNYYYCSDHLSMSENSDLAITHSKGEYVCFLGDDDSVTDKIFKVIEYMDNNNCDSCFGRINRYNWDDFRELHPGSEPYRSYNYSGTYSVLDTMKILNNVLAIGAIEMLNLPRVYHGVVSRFLLDEIKQKTGTFFPGPSPDMASAVAISVFCKKHIQTDIPIIISGFSSNSGGGQGKGGHHKGEISKVGFLPKNIMEIWDERIPEFFSGLTIWPVTFIYSLTQCGKGDLIMGLNFNHIYANLYISHPDLMRAYSCKYVKKFKVYPLVVKNFITRGVSFVLRHYLPSLNKKTSFVTIEADSLKEALAFEMNKE